MLDGRREAGNRPFSFPSGLLMITAGLRWETLRNRQKKKCQELRPWQLFRVSGPRSRRGGDEAGAVRC